MSEKGAARQKTKLTMSITVQIIMSKRPDPMSDSNLKLEAMNFRLGNTPLVLDFSYGICKNSFDPWIRPKSEKSTENL
jgi:hypothetical protein